MTHSVSPAGQVLLGSSPQGEITLISCEGSAGNSQNNVLNPLDARHHYDHVESAKAK